MPYSKGSYESSKKYKEKNIKRVPLDMQIELYEALRQAAERNKESVNGFNRCVHEDADRAYRRVKRGRQLDGLRKRDAAALARNVDHEPGEVGLRGVCHGYICCRAQSAEFHQRCLHGRVSNRDGAVGC